jgi:hypothetical protein
MLEAKGVTLNQIRKVFRREKTILHEEGFVPFLKSMAFFFGKLFFLYSKRYLYEHKLDDCDDIPIIPCKIPDLVVRLIYIPTMTIFDYEQLGEEDFDFPSHPDAQDYKEGYRGVIVFYATDSGEFVQRVAVALDGRGTDYERVYRHIHHPSYPLSSLSDGHTACMSFSITNVKHRRKGAFAHVWSQAFRYLQERGFSKVILMDNANVIAALKIQESLGSKALYKVYSLKLLTLFNFMWLRPCTEPPLVELGIPTQ